MSGCVPGVSGQRPRRGLWLAALLPAVLALAGCKREQRQARQDPPLAAALDQVALLPGGIGGRPPEVLVALGDPFRRNAYQLAEGKRLFEGFGCQSCHAEGQGVAGRGPALLDGWWQYGADLASLYASIRDGRPGGMPAFRDRLTPPQIWQLAGYVQLLGGYRVEAAAPGRSDRPQTRPAENRAPAASFPLRP